MICAVVASYKGLGASRGLLGVIIARAISAPLLAAVKVAEAVGAGHLDVAVPAAAELLGAPDPGLRQALAHVQHSAHILRPDSFEEGMRSIDASRATPFLEFAIAARRRPSAGGHRPRRNVSSTADSLQF